ncbi:MAG: hypothetical protein ACOC00_05675 [Halothiobacillaceae bacterium]
MSTLLIQWMPVYIEPIPHSGERLCIAVAFRPQQGRPRTIKTLPPRAAKCLFRHHAVGMARMAEQITASLDSHNRSGHEMTAWPPPFEGVHAGAVSTIRERTIDAAINTVTENVASLSQATPTPRQSERASDAWAKDIKAHAPRLKDLFNVQLNDERASKITIGFLAGHLAAEFAALNANATWSAQSTTYYRKLINLTMAKQHFSLFRADRLEVLLKTPDRSALSAQQAERLDSLLWDADRAATSLGIEVNPYSTPQDAANHLMRHA